METFFFPFSIVVLDTSRYESQKYVSSAVCLWVGSDHPQLFLKGDVWARYKRPAIVALQLWQEEVPEMLTNFWACVVNEFFCVFFTFPLRCQSNFTTEDSIYALSVQRTKDDVNVNWSNFLFLKIAWTVVYQFFSTIAEKIIYCVRVLQAHFIRENVTSGRIKYIPRLLLTNYLLILRILLLCLQISITKLI